MKECTQEGNMSRFIEISKNDTNILKGFAILLLLCHHLFYEVNGPYSDVHICGKITLVHTLAIYSKLCVAIFVFLSGYGLVRSAESNDNGVSILSFYKKRLVKLLLNYWLIWLLFVPIGVFIFDRTFESVYVNYVWGKAFLDFIGVANAFGFYGYNPTWWFMSLIIVLYLLFPLLWHYRHKPALLVISSLFVYFLVPYRGIGLYLLHFVFGIMCASIRFTPPSRHGYRNMTINMY